MMFRFAALVLPLLIAGCGLSARHRVWYNPERTLDQAKEDIERCYYEAYLTEQDGALSAGLAGDGKNPLMYVEISARQCMRQTGYRRVWSDELEPNVREQSASVHGVSYFIAGR